MAEQLATIKSDSRHAVHLSVFQNKQNGKVSINKALNAGIILTPESCDLTSLSIRFLPCPRLAFPFPCTTRTHPSMVGIKLEPLPLQESAKMRIESP